MMTTNTGTTTSPDFFSFEGTRFTAEDTAAIQRTWRGFYEHWFGPDLVDISATVTDKGLQISGVDRQVTVRSTSDGTEAVVTFDEKLCVYPYGNLALEYGVAHVNDPTPIKDGCAISYTKKNDYTAYLHENGRISVYPQVALRDGVRRKLGEWLSTPRNGAAFTTGTTICERGILSHYIVVPESKVNEACVMPCYSSWAGSFVSPEDVAAISEAAKRIRESKNTKPNGLMPSKHREAA